MPGKIAAPTSLVYIIDEKRPSRYCYINTMSTAGSII